MSYKSVLWRKNVHVLNNIFNHLDIEYIGYNIDYTPYAIKRDKSIDMLCKKTGVKVIK